jgi:HrpA-like RNA helicase
MNAEKFATFFGRVPIFNIPGRTFPVSKVPHNSTAHDSASLGAAARGFGPWGMAGL